MNKKRKHIKRVPSIPPANLSAVKDKPDRFSTMVDLIAHFKYHASARDIATAARRMELRLENLGRDSEDICSGIETASLKLINRNKGYLNAEYAVAGIVLANNDIDSAIEAMDKMASKTGGKEGKRHFTNISDMLKSAKELGLDVHRLGSKRSESTADEIIRVATHGRYNNPVKGLVIVALGQKAPGMVDILINTVFPRIEDSDLWCLGGYIRGMESRRKIEPEDAGRLLDAINDKLGKFGV